MKLYCKISGECESERILKVGEYLTTKAWRRTFLTHGVVCCRQYPVTVALAAVCCSSCASLHGCQGWSSFIRVTALQQCQQNLRDV